MDKKIYITLYDIITRENLDAIGLMQNKIIGFNTDKLGRIDCQYPSIRNKFTKNCNARYKISFNGFNLSQFNMNQLCLKKFKLHNTIWHFAKGDKVEFIKCEMDGFSVTQDSDLTNITLTEPIFKNQQSMENVATLFQTIPLFILNKKNTIALRNLINKGKKININQYDIFSRLYDMVHENELDLFILTLKGAENDSNYEDCVKELMIAAMKADKIDFITAILDNHLVTLNNNTKKTTDLIVNLFHYEKYQFIPVLLLNNLNPDLILENKNIFKVLYFLINQDNLIELNEKIDHDDLFISIHMDEIKSEINRLARALLYLCCDIYHYKYNDKINDVSCLITQLKQILTKNIASDDLTLQMNDLKMKVNEIINSPLSKNALILQLAKQTNKPMSERFALWTYKNSLRISHTELTVDDYNDLCLYLRNHPEVNTLDVSVINISLQSLSLLTKIKSIHELICYDCQFNDAHAKILATAPFLTKLRLVSNSAITLQGAKMIVSNLLINHLYLPRPNDFDKSIWSKVVNEKDTQVRLQYARETGVIPSLVNAPTLFNIANPVPTILNNNDDQDHMKNNLQFS